MCHNLDICRACCTFPCVNMQLKSFALCRKYAKSNEDSMLFCLQGESVTVTVCATEEETAALLATVLDGDCTAASLLARAIHQDPATIETGTEGLNVPLSPKELGIWIDPIGKMLDGFIFPSLQHTVDCRTEYASPASYEIVFSVCGFHSRCHQPVY